MIMFWKSLVIIILLSVVFCTTLDARSEWLGRDKGMHFVTSAYLTFWTHGMSNDIFENSENQSLIISVSLTSMLGAGKELSDKYIKKTRWSWPDMVYNGAGILFGVFLIKALR